MLSHWPCVTWKFFPIWLHKILKLIFQMQPSCHRIICIEHWRKLHNLTTFFEIFLYLKNNDSVEHVLQILHQSSLQSNITPLTYIYYGQKQPIKVHIFEIFKCSTQNLSNYSSQFSIDKSIPLQILHHSFSWHVTPLQISSSHIFYFG